jgi:hypothetical protein
LELSRDKLAFSDLLGARVRDRSGHPLGRVFEVRGRWQPDGSVVVEELMVGRRALWRRLRGPDPAARGISWANVAELRGGEIVVYG